jgi:aminopeptidase-like protein
MKTNLGIKIHQLVKTLFPLHRSLAGPENRKTLAILKKINNKLILKRIRSGTKVFDWKIPNEWLIKEAYILSPEKKKICDIKNNNLHVVSYSNSVNKYLNKKNLLKKIFTLKKRPDAIPYITSYYKKNWGFCLSYNKLKNLKNGKYKVFIDSKFKRGFMNYGEIFIKGSSKKLILFSSYICHPSMANNELSGPSINIYLSNYIKNLKNRKFSYLFLFIPETIGSIAYLSKNIKILKKNLFAGYNLTCLGDNRNYSIITSRNGETVSDFVAKKIINNITNKPKIYSWLERGSDERQYCSPGIDLPITTIMRTKFAEYDEYHTSDDNFTKVVTPNGLNGGYNFLKKIVNYFEKNQFPELRQPCEPFLTKKNLYPTLSSIKQKKITKDLMNIISYCDGKHSIEKISIKTGLKLIKTKKIIRILKKNALLK